MKLSNTIQRRVILEELKKTTSHPTADELYRFVHRRLPRISLGTVYRNLSLLADAGLLMRMEVAGRQTRFDGNPVPHFHLSCSCCGAVEDLPDSDPRFARATEILDECLDERIRAYRVEFSGLCRKCAARKAERPAKTAHLSPHE